MTRRTALWWRIIAFGFRLLYNELAWLYDPVSWIVSLGRWRRWQQSIWPLLPLAGRVLEVGFGPGHLLGDLASRQAESQQIPPDSGQPVPSYQVVGLDLSSAMLRLARRNLRRRGVSVPLCRGRAQALPFAARSFDAVVVTFPTSYVYELACIDGLAHVLDDGGRLIVVEMARLIGRKPHVRFLEWLFRITGQRGPATDLSALLGRAGLAAWRERFEIDGTAVTVITATRSGVTG